MRKIVTIAALGVLLISFISPPASAQFFLCEKTNQNGEPIPPDSPQYRLVEYDVEAVPLLRDMVSIALGGIFVIGVAGGIYATIRDAMYTAEGDSDPAKYVKMRIRLILLGIGFPVLVFVGSFIIESITRYETTCIVPSIF